MIYWMKLFFCTFAVERARRRYALRTCHRATRLGSRKTRDHPLTQNAIFSSHQFEFEGGVSIASGFSLRNVDAIFALALLLLLPLLLLLLLPFPCHFSTTAAIEIDVNF